MAIIPTQSKYPDRAGYLGLDTDRNVLVGMSDGILKDMTNSTPAGWINVEDFGAKGDGVTDDTEAFQAISNYVNAKGYGVINFGYNKVYRVGRQTFTGVADGAAYASQKMLYFNNCKFIIINGNGSTLKLNDGLHYGSFDPVTGEVYNPPSGLFTDYNYAATIGNIVEIRASRNIIISNLNIDGNSDNIIVGGRWGDYGIQLHAHGLSLKWTSNIFINNVHSSYNGLDGLCLKGNRLTENAIGSDNIFIVNSKFEYNGRQGVSIGGGKGIKFINCLFSNTGQGAIFSPPGDGVDIEPNIGEFAQNISFDNCLFENNRNIGLHYFSRAKNIIANHCEFWGGFENSGQPIYFDHSNGSQILNSKIHGAIRYLVGVTIQNCKIDDAIHPTYGQSGLNDIYLLTYTWHSTFNNCIIERTAPNYRFVDIHGPTKFIDCTFNYKGDFTESQISNFNNSTVINCIFQDDVIDKNKTFFHWAANENLFFNTKNLGPNVFIEGLNTGANIGEIPSNMNTVWNSGNTRPTEPQIGQRFFDTTLGKPIWFNGTDWIDATGTPV